MNVSSCKADLTRQRTVTVCTWLSPNAPLDALTADFPSCKKAQKE